MTRDYFLSPAPGGSGSTLRCLIAAEARRGVPAQRRPPGGCDHPGPAGCGRLRGTGTRPGAPRPRSGHRRGSAARRRRPGAGERLQQPQGVGPGGTGGARGRARRKPLTPARPPRLPRSRRAAPAAEGQPSASAPASGNGGGARGRPRGVRRRRRARGRRGAHLYGRYLSSSGRRGMRGTLRLRAAPRRPHMRGGPPRGQNYRGDGGWAASRRRAPSWG